MFRKIREKWLKQRVVELKKNGYYLVLVSKDQDAKDAAEVFNNLFQEDVDAPKIVIMSSEYAPKIRIIEIE